MEQLIDYACKRTSSPMVSRNADRFYESDINCNFFRKHNTIQNP